MAVKETIQIGDPRLKAKNKKVTDSNSEFIQQLIKDLKDTMLENRLIGIAGPQIGENYKIFVTQPRKTESRGSDEADAFRVFINPEIIKESKEEVIIYEGCGSVLNGQLFGPVSRPKEITIRAQDADGSFFEYTADGILGRVIQHEYDHLYGIEFLEKISNYKEIKTYEHYVNQIKNEAWHKKNSQITVKKYRKLK